MQSHAHPAGSCICIVLRIKHYLRMCLIAIATPMVGKDAIVTGCSGIINAEVNEAFAAFIAYFLLMLAH